MIHLEKTVLRIFRLMGWHGQSKGNPIAAETRIVFSSIFGCNYVLGLLPIVIFSLLDNQCVSICYIVCIYIENWR